MLLKAGDAAAALQAFTENLQVFPYNGWALLGASSALEALGRKPQADVHASLARDAWRYADYELKSPCPQLS